ncbi:conserved hypothetical protein [Ricinus communis]|uniref:WW domain-containing protein n=1 Tax=Ricinus communis TaxID=3988 RepID=B9SS84_RICCO|nr:conserved hypothetical protein [Ricinus communis]
MEVTGRFQLLLDCVLKILTGGMSTIITAIISASISLVSICYTVSKDAYAYLEKKLQYSRNLEENYEALYWGLDNLLRLRTDINQYIQRKGIKSPTICKNWNNRVWKIDGESRILFNKYRRTRKSWVLPRAKLSRKMVKLLEKITDLQNDGKELGKLLTGNSRNK